jgi:hypothetical protein
MALEGMFGFSLSVILICALVVSLMLAALAASAVVNE